MLIIFIIMGTVLLEAGFYLEEAIIFSLGADIISVSIILAILFSTRNPNFFITLKNDILQQEYEISLVRGIDIDVICNRIRELMEEKKIFTDENLKLHHLAEELLISPKKLSYILNKHYGNNFNEFINGYRIDEAKKNLLRDKNISILNIAYDVGFNTKSSFNSQFLKFTKMAPSDYKKKHLKKSS